MSDLGPSEPQYAAALCPSVAGRNSPKDHLDRPRLDRYIPPSRGPVAQLVEQLTFNQWVTGSNPVGLTNKINGLNDF